MSTDTKIKVLEKGLDLAPIQRKINEPELRRDFNEFCRRMPLKWHFRDEPLGFNVTPAFTPKSTWHPPKGHACVAVFLRQVAKEILRYHLQFCIILICLEKSGRLLDILTDDRSIVIKKADKGSCVVVWNRSDYLQEAERQLSDKRFTEKLVTRKISSVSYWKQVIECFIVLKGEVF